MERFWLASRLRDDEKWLALTAAEKVAVIEGMCWTAEHEKDGVVPASIIGRHAAKLVECGWLATHSAGYVYPTWKKHQITRAKLNAKRKAGKERMQRARSVRAHPPSTPAAVSPTEVEVEGKVEVDDGGTAIAARPRRAGIDHLIQACGGDPLAATASVQRTAGVKLAAIRTAEKNRRSLPSMPTEDEPELLAEITTRAERYQRRWPEWALTVSALAEHWHELGSDIIPNGRPKRGSNDHLAELADRLEQG